MQRLDMVDVSNSTDLVGLELKLRRLLVTLVRRARPRPIWTSQLTRVRRAQCQSKSDPGAAEEVSALLPFSPAAARRRRRTLPLTVRRTAQMEDLLHVINQRPELDGDAMLSISRALFYLVRPFSSAPLTALRRAWRPRTCTGPGTSSILPSGPVQLTCSPFCCRWSAPPAPPPRGRVARS
jgi:hypothetical protein